jgi:hypothetical protein
MHAQTFIFSFIHHTFIHTHIPSGQDLYLLTKAKFWTFLQGSRQTFQMKYENVFDLNLCKFKFSFVVTILFLVY